MDRVACLDSETRKDLFRETAAHMGDMSPVIIEKDFWVCWLLKQLFSAREFQGWLVFKGGTSLSKCFNLIKRFSEDIDLAVDYEKLGFTGTRDPRDKHLSHTKRGAVLAEMLTACQAYVGGPFIETLRELITNKLGPTGWDLRVSSDDANTVEFVFPSALDARLDYIKPAVVLELGTHAEPVPQETRAIHPFAADYFPQVFDEELCSVLTVVARRTFWEKATILHAEYHRPLNKPMLPRYSRHYADVAEMAQYPVKNEALADIDLLRAVCTHKDRFYHCGWARYLDAKPGSFHLLPRPERVSALRKDYQSMQAMFFYEHPDFEVILERLNALEDEINSTA